MKVLTIVQDNHPGLLAEVTTLLEREGIGVKDFTGTSLGDTAVLTLTVGPYLEAFQLLSNAGYKVVASEHIPGPWRSCRGSWPRRTWTYAACTSSAAMSAPASWPWKPSTTKRPAKSCKTSSSDPTRRHAPFPLWVWIQSADGVFVLRCRSQSGSSFQDPLQPACCTCRLAIPGRLGCCSRQLTVLEAPTRQRPHRSGVHAARVFWAPEVCGRPLAAEDFRAQVQAKMALRFSRRERSDAMKPWHVRSHKTSQ